MSEVNESALTLFEELKVPATLRSEVYEFDPDFDSRSGEDQRALLVFLVEQHQGTTEGTRLRLPVIKFLHAGANAIQMPPKAGEEMGQVVREFEAVILDQHPSKAYWEKGPDEGGISGPPDCASMDALKPYTKNPVNADCFSCPFNLFGSALKGKGKRCRDVKRLVVYVDGHNLPMRLSLSAMNIRHMDAYLSTLVDQKRAIGTVVTRFKATEDRNKEGTTFTGVELSTARVLKGLELLDMAKVKDTFGKDFRAGGIEEGEVGQPSGPPPAEQEGAQKARDVM